MSTDYQAGYAAAMRDLANEKHVRMMADDYEYAAMWESKQDTYPDYSGTTGHSGYNADGEPTFG